MLSYYTKSFPYYSAPLKRVQCSFYYIIYSTDNTNIVDSLSLLCSKTVLNRPCELMAIVLLIIGAQMEKRYNEFSQV
jgi:hypothetical protein